MDDGSACWSALTLTSEPSRESPRSGPGEVTDADDEDLRHLRRTIAEPVATSLLTDEELESISVHRDVGDEPDGVWVRVVAVGEVFHGWLVQPARPGTDDFWTPQRCAEGLADSFEDWIAESGFGWGQQRTARCTLPPS